MAYFDGRDMRRYKYKLENHQGQCQSVRLLAGGVHSASPHIWIFEAISSSKKNQGKFFVSTLLSAKRGTGNFL